MRRLFLHTIVVAGISLPLLAAGCGGSRASQRQLVARSPGVKPMWIQQCPAPDKDNLVFCGEARARADEKQACAAAYADALGKLTRHVGQKVDARLERDAAGGYRFQLRGAASQPLTLRGVWEDQRWYESYRRAGAARTDCWVMLVYPRLEYENLVGMARRAQAERVSKAAALYAEARQAAGRGCQGQAAEKLRLALQLVEGLREPIVLEGVGDSKVLAEQIRSELDRAERELQRTGKTVLVVLEYRQDGNHPPPALTRSLATSVAQWFEGHGFQVKPGRIAPQALQAILSGDRQAAVQAAACRGVGWLAVVDVHSEYLGAEDGIHFAQAGGSFRLLRSQDGRVIKVVELQPEKQGHPNSRRQALELSVKKLGQRSLHRAVEQSLAGLAGG